MDLILDTITLEYEKSIFIVDLMKHETGEVYVSVTQTIIESQQKQKLKINKDAIVDITFALQHFNKKIFTNKTRTSESYFTDEKIKSIIQLYMKGLTFESLALAFNCTAKMIKEIIANERIELVDNSFPKEKKKFFRFPGKKK